MKNNHYQIVQLLITAAYNNHNNNNNNGLTIYCDINGLNKNGESPLMIATSQKHHECMGILMTYGANPNQRRKNIYNTPCCISCEIGDLIGLKILLSNQYNIHGTDILLPDNNGITPFMYAAMNGHDDIIEYIYDYLMEYCKDSVNGNANDLFTKEEITEYINKQTYLF